MRPYYTGSLCFIGRNLIYYHLTFILSVSWRIVSSPFLPSKKKLASNCGERSKSFIHVQEYWTYREWLNNSVRKIIIQTNWQQHLATDAKKSRRNASMKINFFLQIMKYYFAAIYFFERNHDFKRPLLSFEIATTPPWPAVYTQAKQILTCCSFKYSNLKTMHSDRGRGSAHHLGSLNVVSIVPAMHLYRYWLY